LCKIAPLILCSMSILFIPPAFAGAINFDDQQTNPAGISGIDLSNQYAAEGVLFSSIAASQSFHFNIIPPSSPNYASPFFSGGSVGQFTFVEPLDPSVPAFVDSVTFTLVGLTAPAGHPGFFSGATIDALDLAGNVIPGETLVIPATSTSTSDMALTFTGQVHAIRFTQTPGTSGAFPFDDLTFGAVSTPEPDAWELLGASLISLAAWRRCRAQRKEA